MTHPGENTVDLGPLRTTEPGTEPGTPDRRHDDKERRLRRFGTISLVGGIAVEVLLIVASLGMAVVSDNDAYSNPTAELFAVLAHLTFVTIAGAFIAIGGVERLSRRYRAQVSHNTRELDEVRGDLAGLKQVDPAIAEVARATDRNRILIERHIVDSNERYTDLIGLVGAIPGRVHENTELLAKLAELQEGIAARVLRIEAEVAPPLDYGAGLEHGMRLRGSVGDAGSS